MLIKFSPPSYAQFAFKICLSKSKHGINNTDYIHIYKKRNKHVYFKLKTYVRKC